MHLPFGNDIVIDSGDYPDAEANQHVGYFVGRFVLAERAKLLRRCRCSICAEKKARRVRCAPLTGLVLRSVKPTGMLS